MLFVAVYGDGEQHYTNACRSACLKAPADNETRCRQLWAVDNSYENRNNLISNNNIRTFLSYSFLFLTVQHDIVILLIIYVFNFILILIYIFIYLQNNET